MHVDGDPNGSCSHAWYTLCIQCVVCLAKMKDTIKNSMIAIVTS